MKRLTATAAAALVLLTGCGTGTAPAAQPSTPDPAPVAAANPTAVDGAVADNGVFNATDVMFAQMMAAQYAPAAEILALAGKRTTDEQVRMLAAAVDVTQADELAAVRTWLRDWRQPAGPDTRPSLHEGHGGLPATGPAEIEALREAPDADFDKTFLNLLIAHQHQAVEYARMELSSGTNPAAKALAQRIDQSRTAQIQLMLRLVA